MVLGDIGVVITVTDVAVVGSVSVVVGELLDGLPV